MRLDSVSANLKIANTTQASIEGRTHVPTRPSPRAAGKALRVFPDSFKSQPTPPNGVGRKGTYIERLAKKVKQNFRPVSVSDRRKDAHHGAP
ncbi:MAG: hypothetical protein ABL996_17420, partial [Micropepsaceae bacterium]